MKCIVEEDFSGYVIGGFFVGELKEFMYEMIEVLYLILLEDRFCYLMGVGILDCLYEFVICGVDMFDCVFVICIVRNGIVFIKEG